MRPPAAAAAAEAPGESATRLGPIEVRTDRAAVLEFQRGCGHEPVPGIVPLVFPIRWLALPVIRAHILGATSACGLVPVHESQSFTITCRLDLDRDYLLAVELTRTTNPDRLMLRGTVSTPSGDLCVEFETVLRLVGLGGSGAR